MPKRILITGGAGFVGSSLAIKLKENYPAFSVLALDNLKRRGSELNLVRLREAGVDFYHGDVRNPEDFDSLPSVDIIIEASAEPSVLAGINDLPNYVVNTNLFGTINCLNYAVTNQAAIIFLSTSRVYPIENIERIAFDERETRFEIAPDQTLSGVSKLGISETFPMEGYRSLYGATKLCSELLINEYNQFYDIKTIINRCGVLAGPWQMGKVDQGVIVLWVAKHVWRQNLGYFGYGGEGKQVRDVLHINDLYRLIDHQIHHFDELNNQLFNVGGGLEISASLCELTEICRRLTGNNVEIDSIPENRQADIRIYITDNSKVIEATGWKPEIGIAAILEDIFLWLRKNESSLEGILR